MTAATPNPGRTLIGITGNYNVQASHHVQASHPGHAMQGYAAPQGPGSGPQPVAYPQHYSGQMPAQQMYGGYPMAPSPYHTVDTPPPQPAYSGQQPAVVPVEGRKPRRGSLGRDIAVGVAIAVFVLGGFLVVKFLVLDSGGDAAPAAAATATIRIEMGPGTAELEVDGARIATAENKREFLVSAGTRKVKLLAKNGAKCEQEMTLPADKTTVIKCELDATAPAAPKEPAAKPAEPAAKPAEPAADKPAEPAADKPAEPAKPADAAPAVAADKPAEPHKPEPKPELKAEPPKPEPKAEPKPEPKADKPVVAKPADPPVSAKPADKPVVAKPADKPADPPKPVKPADKPRPRAQPDDDNPADKAAAIGTMGFLTITSTPRAKVLVDGVDTGKSTPIKKLPLAPGRHKIQFVVGSDKHTYPVIIKAGETQTLDKNLQ